MATNITRLLLCLWFSTTYLWALERRSSFPAIDIGECDFTKGCYKVPDGCQSFAECTQIVSWRLSPDDETSVRFEMAAALTYQSNDVDYLAFGLSPTTSFMPNASVLVCGKNAAGTGLSVYLSHNEKAPSSNSRPLEGDLATIGISLIRSDLTSSHLSCVVDQKIQPSDAQADDIFPLDQFWYPAMATGPNSGASGLLSKHYRAFKLGRQINCAEGANRPDIDLTACGKTKGCIKNPPDCTTSANCDQIITWTVSPSRSSHVQFEMMSTLTYSSQNVEYLAFGLTPSTSQIMSNASILVCGKNSAGTSVTAYLSHNEGGSSSNPLPDSSTSTELNLISSELASSHLSCVVERKITPSSDQLGKVFPLDELWYPAWAVGPNSASGVLRYHGSTKEMYDEMVNCSSAVSLQITTTPAGSHEGPDIDLTACDETRKGCVRNPPDCATSSSCDQIITWTISPSNPSYVQFEMMSALRYSSQNVEYLAFGLTPSRAQIMSNSSVLVCGKNSAGTGIIGYLSHNEGGTNYPLSDSFTSTDINLIRGELANSYIFCVVEQKISPSTEHQGKIFPLDEFWYPAWAVGPNSVGGFLGYHGNTKQMYNEMINCSSAVSPTASPVDRDLMRKLHGVFMMIGWMLCVGASILTPRYLRDHWTSMLCSVQLWFFIHRGLMLSGVLFVGMGLFLILAVHDFLLIDMGPDYPDILHPGFGLVAIVILMLNPVVSIFRCKPDAPLRTLFNWVHGMLGGLGFALAVINIVIGTMYYPNNDNVLYCVIAWAATHICIEIFFLFVYCFGSPEPTKKKKTKKEQVPSQPISTRPLGVVLEVEVEPAKSLSYKLSTALFVFYITASIVLTVTASVFLFVDN